MNFLQAIKSRYFILSAVVTILFAVLGLKAVDLTIVRGEEFRDKADNIRLRQQAILASRGPIYDTNGTILAKDRLGYNIIIRRNQVVDEKLNETSKLLLEIFSKNQDKYVDSFQIIINPYAYQLRNLVRELKVAEGIGDNIEDYRAFEQLRTKYAAQFQDIYNQGTLEDDNKFPNKSVTALTANEIKRALQPFVTTGNESIRKWLISKDISVNATPKEAYEILANRYIEQIVAAFNERVGAKGDFEGRDITTVETVFEDLTPAEIRNIMALYIEDFQWYVPISPSTWEYTNIKDDKEKLAYHYKKYGVTEQDSYEEMFYKIRKGHGIKNETSDIEARGIMAIRHEVLTGLGHLPINVAIDVKSETMLQVTEMLIELPGVDIEIAPVRVYPMGNTASHILGHLGKIEKYELDEFTSLGYKYRNNALVGKAGVESTFQHQLSGTDGVRYVEVNAANRVMRELDYLTTPPIPGDSVYLTIDSRLQKIAEEALAENMRNIQEGKMGRNADGSPRRLPANIGAVVAMNVKTGEILAMASNPDYDPNLFAKGEIPKEIYDSLKPDEGRLMEPKPLFNQAIRQGLPAGSTFKMITGLTGLETGIINDRTVFTCTGLYQKYNKACWIYNRKTRAGSHGVLAIYRAMAVSCNLFFFEIGDRTGYKPVEDYARQFGLGSRTGIELPKETAGNIPNPTFKLDLQKNVWRSWEIRPYVKKLWAERLGKEEKDLTKEEIIEANEKAEQIVAIVDELKLADDDTVITLAQISRYIRNRVTELDIINKAQYNNTEYARKLQDLADFTYEYVFAALWRGTDTADLTIGQGGVDVTPLQMANYISIIANNGVENKPHIVRKVVGSNGETKFEAEVQSKKAVELQGNPRNFEIIQKAMNEVSKNGGVGTQFRNFPYEVAVKTGTAQFNPNFVDFGWFVGYAPLEDPQIAVAVVMFQGSSGAYNIPTFQAIVEAYLSGEDSEEKINNGNVLQP